MNLWQWRQQVLDTLAYLSKPAIGLVLPPDLESRGHEQLDALTEIRKVLCPEDGAVDPWKCTLERWASNLAECHRQHTMESLRAIAMTADRGIERALKKTNQDWVRVSDFATIKYFSGPTPWAAGVIGDSSDFGNLADDPYILDGHRVLVLGFALPGLPWRPRPFYPRDLVKRLTADHRRVQAEGEAAEARRLRDQQEQERWARERTPEHQIASLQRRLAVLERS